MSALGKKKYEDADAKKYALAEKWTELVSSGKLGYMALLRNLRNILEADVDISIVKDVAKRIGNAQEVQKSKQFPFRFLSAYRELKNISNGKVSAIIDSLEEAIQASAMNINGFSNDTRVLLACDVSGSMYTSISPKSSVKNYDIGLVLAMLLRNRCENVVTGIFGDTWKVVNMPSKGILSNVEQMYMREGEVGYSTNGYKVIEYLRSNNIVMDKVMMFTDCQMWNSNGSGQTIQGEWKKYKEIVPDAKLYLFDLNGYGLSPLKMVDGDVALIAGWSDRVFDMLEAIEQGSTILDKIKEIDL